MIDAPVAYTVNYGSKGVVGKSIRPSVFYTARSCGAIEEGDNGVRVEGHFYFSGSEMNA